MRTILGLKKQKTPTKNRIKKKYKTPNTITADEKPVC